MLKTKNKSKLALYILDFISIAISLVGIILLLIAHQSKTNDFFFNVVDPYQIFTMINVLSLIPIIVIFSLAKIVGAIAQKQFKTAIITFLLLFLVVCADFAELSVFMETTGGV